MCSGCAAQLRRSEHRALVQHVLLMAALAAALATAASAAQPHALLDPSVNVWDIREPGPYHNWTTERVPNLCMAGKCGLSLLNNTLPWRMDDLKHAVMADHPEQFGPLFQKLHSGQPIKVLAYGSSLTHWQAGCFHTGSVSEVAAKVGAKGMPSWSNIYRDDLAHLPFGACTYYNAHGVGWGNAFMQVINGSFPHADHTFINAGRSATKLHDFANLGCLDEHLPADLDLLILENLAALSGGGKVEHLMWRVIQHYQGRREQTRPAIILLTSAWVTHEGQEYFCLGDQARCDKECGGRPFNHSLALPDTSPVEQHGKELIALANHYGLTMISHRNFLLSGLVLGWPEREQINLCKWLAAVHCDALHLAPLGHRLFTHYMLHVLAGAEKHLVTATPMEGWNLPLKMPEAELFPRARQLRETRCPTLVGAAPGVGPEGVLNGSLALITSMDGWQYVEQQVNEQGGMQKYKPGWISSTVGAKLRAQINTVMGSPEPGAHGVSTLHPPATLSVTYLASYERMGAATISCISGCICTPVTMDAHNPSMRATVVALAHVPVTASPLCEFEIEVLAHTNSTDHRWKLISITLSSGLSLAKEDAVTDFTQVRRLKAATGVQATGLGRL